MITKIDLHIAKRFLKLTVDSQLSQEELAGIFGFKSRVSIANMIRGKQTFSSSHIYLICSVFNVAPNDLFPTIVKTTIVKQKRKVIIIPKTFSVKNVPKIKFIK